MRRVLLATSLIALAAVAAGCNRPNTAYNNSGASASAPTGTPGAPATAASSTDPASPTASGTVATAPDATSTPPGAPRNVVADTVTTGKVRTAIAADDGMKDSDITVTANNGVVVLSGTARSQDQVTMATNLAQRQEGVSRVETQVVVR
jgi:hyperosmotically inducible protein